MWAFPFHTDDAGSLDWEGLKSAFPWAKEMEGVEQDPVFHAEGDVAIHTEMVVKELLASSGYRNASERDRRILFASAVLHDVEKRSTTEKVFEDGRMKVTSKGHARKGEGTSRAILYRDIPTPFAIRESICKLVKHHALPVKLFVRDDPRMEVLKAGLHCDMHMLAVLAEADMRGRISKSNDLPELLYEIGMFVENCKENGCYDRTPAFPSDITRFQYFNKEGIWPEQEMFDDTKCNVYIMCGIPGSGKDHYINKHLSHLPMVSMDSIRREYRLGRNNKHDKGQVIQMAKQKAKDYLGDRCDFVWNATNITKTSRDNLISLMLPYKPKIHIIYVERPYERLRRDNLNREFPVRQSAIEEYINKLQVPDLTEAHTVAYHIIDNDQHDGKSG